jgi:uncharacterized membrane protein YkvA (DUF1232 family)
MDDRQALISNAVDDSQPPERRAMSDVAVEGALIVPNTVKLLVRLVSDPRVSLRRKVPIAAAIAYVASPINLIPDALLGFGALDDAVVMSLAVDNLLANTDQAIVLEHWDGTVDALDLAMSFLRWGSTLLPGRR